MARHSAVLSSDKNESSIVICEKNKDEKLIPLKVYAINDEFNKNYYYDHMCVMLHCCCQQKGEWLMDLYARNFSNLESKKFWSHFSKNYDVVYDEEH